VRLHNVPRQSKSLLDAGPPMSILTAEAISCERAPRAGRAPRLGLLLALAALSQTACAARAVPPQAPEALTPLPVAKAAPAEVNIGDSLVREDELTYKGYTVRKYYKDVREREVPGGRVEVAYAALERGGKTVRSFDAGVYSGFGNSVKFGLFPFLGGEEKQLVISQDAPRAGAQWVVSLSPRPRVIYDGPAFEAGREYEDMGVADLDGDGVYEIAVPVCRFYGFRGWATADTPLPLALFKYDAKAGKYLPANRLFRGHLLKDVEQEKSKVSGPETRESHTAGVLSVVLDYVYAGEERAGWEFYDAAYKLPDKAALKRDTEAALRADPVYRYIYQPAPRR